MLLLEVPTAEGDLGHHLLEHRYMAGLEELYLALDQLWRLVDGVQAHHKGEEFLEAYCVKDRNMGADPIYTAAHNEEPAPFIWTAEVEQILKKVGRGLRQARRSD